jgi:plastocyanin
MNRFIVTVKHEGNQTTCDPAEVIAGAGDSVQWICKDGDLAMDFGDRDPFTSKQVWRALRGELTPVAIVRPGPHGGIVVEPTVSINGKVVAESLGELRLEP